MPDSTSPSSADPRAGLPPPPAHLPGLTQTEAAERLRRFGPNQLVPDRKVHPTLKVVWRAVTEPMALLLLIAAATYGILGETIDAVAALAALIPITAVSVVLERRAERALQELSALTAPTAVVVRDSRWRKVPAREVVPGDLMAAWEGDVLAADGVLVDGMRVVVDESALTGESVPIVKGTGEADRSAWAGTTIRDGRGVVEVSATGAATQYGKIGGLVASARETRTPLEQVVRKLVARLGVVAGVLALLVGMVQVIRGSGWGAGIIAGVSLGIAAVPEEFPLVFTIYLALGARRLARHRALVRRLTGVETLGSTTTICTDKTGTLTVGSLEVSALEPVSRHPAAMSLLEAAVLACEPDPFDPLDQAILRHAITAGIDVEALHGGRLIADYEFDPVHKLATHVWQHGELIRVVAKGSVEGILHVSQASPEATNGAERAMRDLGALGMRVIAVAGGRLEEPGSSRGDNEAALALAGLVAFADPARPEVSQAIDDCRTAGIRVVMITGDHPVTAQAVADGLGMAGRVVTGAELDAATDDELAAMLSEAAVFARMRPEQKHRLVEGLKAQGEVVAMTGDGINDAPALREAHIGVAMGLRGTAVAREASVLILLDDNFATIVEAVREGRRVFTNLRHAFSYLVAFHIPLLLLALLVPLLGRPLLLLPFQLIALEFLLHPIVALVFERDPAPPGVMQEPPRPPEAGLLDRRLLLPSLRGVTLALATGAVYLATLGTGTDHARGVALATLFLGELLLVLVERSAERPLWRRSPAVNRALAPILGLAGFVTGLLFLLPPARSVMQIAPLTGTDWLVAAGFAALATLWTEPLKAPLTARRTA